MILRRVSGHSMLPSFAPGDLIFALGRRAKVGDAIIFELGDKEYLKRIKSIDQSGTLTVEGDNRQDSWDSKDFGDINNENIKAVVRFRIGRPRLVYN